MIVFRLSLHFYISSIKQKSRKISLVEQRQCQKRTIGRSGFCRKWRSVIRAVKYRIRGILPPRWGLFENRRGPVQPQRDGRSTACFRSVSGIVCGRPQDGQIHIEHHRRLDRSYHGTGDLFASAFVGALASGKSEPEAARIASNFTLRSIENTYDQPAHQYGVKFETALPELIRSLSEW